MLLSLPKEFQTGNVESGSTGAMAATPEPGSLVLVGTGMLGLVGADRRRFFAKA